MYAPCITENYFCSTGSSGIRAIPVGGDGNPTTVGGTSFFSPLAVRPFITLIAGVNSAILRYDGAPDAEPNSTAIANPINFNEADVIVRPN